MTRQLRLALIVAGVAAVIVAGLYLLQPDLAAALFTVDVGTQVLQVSIPLALAALCGAITERAGVVDLALEAKLITGAFVAAAVSHWSGSAYVGVLGGITAGIGVATIQMLCALRLRADQVIIGIALNLLALTGTRFCLVLIYGESANMPAVPGFEDALLTNPNMWIAVLAAVLVPVAMVHTRWGLRLRAAGDRPESLVAVGVSPAKTRLWAGLVGGALAGAGGSQLSLSLGGFHSDMSAGRGYMAVAMVILARWRPTWAVIACVGVVIADTANTQLQITGSAIPRELAPLLPYVLTLLVLVIAGGSPPPRALGKLS